MGLKLTSLRYRDYAATYGLFEDIGEDLNITKKEHGDLLYALYLDDPMRQGGSRQRYFTGILTDGSGKAMKKKLIANNDAIIAKFPPLGEHDEKTPIELFRRQKWSVGDFPSVDAAVVQFPSTNGFMSALITSYWVSFVVFCIASLLKLGVQN